MDKGKLFFWTWQLGSIPTLIYLMFFDTTYTWWNWIFMIPMNFFLAEIWPIFWFFKWIGFA